MRVTAFLLLALTGTIATAATTATPEGSVAGVARIKIYGGVLGCNGPVSLIPVTPATAAAMQRDFGSTERGRMTGPGDSSARHIAVANRTVRTVQCRYKSSFAFDHVPAGAYFLLADLRSLGFTEVLEAPGNAGVEQRGALLMKRVDVRPAARIEVKLGDG